MSYSENKTKFFQNCLGVFQGGGCKGSAYVGAFIEATKRGVSFSELVGTSAGSIIAVFIGAGTTPEQLRLIINDLDFKRFLTPPKKIDEYIPPKYSEFLSYVPLIRKYKKIVTHLGLYNSDALQDWVTLKLNEILKRKLNDPPVKFKDLIIPTSVVSTDIKTRKLKVWSTKFTPEDEVAEAVKSSCNIPIFFQPVKLRYIDGGLLSNLPSFIFENLDKKIYNKVLAFSLESEIENSNTNSFLGFLKSILDTTLDGNLDIQMSLQKNLHIIKINTGDIAATDFDKIDSKKIDFLVLQGISSTKQFFDNELSNINDNVMRGDISKDSFRSNNIITQTTNYKNDEILIVETNTDWVYNLFPTLLNWRVNHTNIKLLLKNNTDDTEHGSYRLRFLKSMGVEVVNVDEIPFRGYIFNGNNKEKCSALIFNPNLKEDSLYHTKHYYGDEDSNVIRILRDNIISLFSPTIKKTSIEIKRVEKEDVFRLLRSVKQYSSNKIDIYMKEVEINNILFLSKYVRGFKYRQISHLFDIFKESNIPFFEPAKLKLLNKKTTIITPPVLEKIGDSFFVIEGNTRLTYAFRNGIKSLKCIIVEGVDEALPSTGRYKVNEILLTDEPKIGDERYEGFDYKKYRKIEKAIRNPKNCLI